MVPTVSPVAEVLRSTNLVFTLHVLSEGCLRTVWTNVAYTKNGPLDPGKFYVNGQSIPNALTQATFNFSLATTNSYIAAIGSRTDNIPSFTFSGMIDEVKVYNQALASADIEQIYAMGALSHGLALK